MTEQRRHSQIVRVRHIRAAAMLAASSLIATVGILVAAPPVSAAPLQTACPGGTLDGTTYTLTADCAITEPLTVPDGFTLDGGGFTISATDAELPVPSMARRHCDQRGWCHVDEYPEPYRDRPG